MSSTYQYDAGELTVDVCLDVLKGKNPSVVPEGERLFLSWDDTPREGYSRYGVWLRKGKNNMSIAKGCVNVWNGQAYLQEYLSERGIEILWWD